LAMASCSDIPRCPSPRPQIAAWLLLVAIQYELPYVSANKAALWVVRGVSAGAVFFAIVAVAQFGASPLKVCALCACTDIVAASAHLPHPPPSSAHGRTSSARRLTRMGRPA